MCDRRVRDDRAIDFALHFNKNETNRNKVKTIHSKHHLLDGGICK